MRDTCIIALSATTIRTRDQDGVPVVEVTGEVDMTSAGTVLAILTAQLDRRPAAVVADLTGTVFFGSDGIRALVDATARARHRGITMAVVADHRVVLRPLRLTGTDEVLDVHPTVDLAVAALTVGRTQSVAR